MKRLIGLITVCALALFAFSAFTLEAKKPVKWEKVVFSTHIHCQACIDKMEANLAYERGVKGLEFSLEDQTVTFLFDPKKTDRQTLAQAMKKIGYEGVEITSCDDSHEQCDDCKDCHEEK